MTDNPTDLDTGDTTTSTWMSSNTVATLQGRHAELVQAAAKFDELAEDARKEVVAAEQKLERCKNLAAGARKGIGETQILLAIAQGRAPRPNRSAISADGMSLQFGALRVAGPPDNPTRDDYAAHAGLMRTVIAAALDIADRADTAAATAPRTWTPDARNPDGSTTVRPKRGCNGCGTELGDATETEINASVEGRPLSDVRGECPRCSGADAVEQPATATGAEPLAPDTRHDRSAALPTPVEDGESR